MSYPAEPVGGLRCLVVDPGTSSTASVVLILHGYGMQPDDLAPFTSSLQLEAAFYLPEAPLPAVPSGRAWWPIDQAQRATAMAVGPRDLRAEHPLGAESARRLLGGVVDEIRRRHPGVPMVLVGFSQGGMLACDAVLRDGLSIAGLALLSASRISTDEWAPLAARLAKLPVLVSHGTRDSDLGFHAGEGLRDFCSEAGAAVTWVPFEGEHGIPLVVWRALRKFIRALADQP